MSRKRKKSKKRWIVVNGEREDFSAQLPQQLFPSDPYLAKNRPKIQGHKDSRFVKDIVYLHIHKQMQVHRVRGPYIGLAAAFFPEICDLFEPRIKGTFYTCQFRRVDFKKLLQYEPLVTELYPKVDFHLQYGDIIDVMRANPRKFAVLDLDFMWILNKKRAREVAKAVSIASKDKATVAVWHSANRVQKNGDHWTDNVYRPYLRRQLQRHFNIRDHDEINYYEGYPMRVDIFTLERKAA